MTTVRVIVVNCNFANPQPKIRGILQGLAGEYDPDVWLLCETNRGRVRRWLGKGWRTHQGRVGGRENNAVAWVSSTITPRRGRFLIGAFPRPGVVMEARWINRQRLIPWGTREPVAFHTLHVPPSRYDALVPGFMRRVARSMRLRRGVWGGDRNQGDMRDAAMRAGHYYREYGVMFLVSSFPITWWVHRAVKGLDHHVIVADIEVS